MFYTHMSTVFLSNRNSYLKICFNKENTASYYFVRNIIIRFEQVNFTVLCIVVSLIFFSFHILCLSHVLFFFV